MTTQTPSKPKKRVSYVKFITLVLAVLPQVLQLLEDDEQPFVNVQVSLDMLKPGSAEVAVVNGSGEVLKVKTAKVV